MIGHPDNPVFPDDGLQPLLDEIGWKPCLNWLIVQPAEAPSMTSGGLHLPDAYKRRTSEGEVLRVGPGAVSAFKEGDYVAFTEYQGEPIKIKGKEYFFVRATDIICKR